ncbi:hypothetical protein BJ875DRAFT_449050 [Amylocarpus encephaloides]|uniref:Uncharacterized protein n=1 Tax=Amylocarpus encephaloides TaxID=45428 RepID=A0A9P7YTX3_9HELO|nr:hypothetical protein BJ875DRAFT_449050 [Amylocarpus encephaloides]
MQAIKEEAARIKAIKDQEEAEAEAEAEAESRAKHDFYEELKYDLAVAREWAQRLDKDETQKKDDDGDMTPKQAHIGSFQSSDDHNKDVEQKLANSEATMDQTNQQNTDEIPMESEFRELVLRTGQRLREDAFRMLHLIAFLNGSERKLDYSHVIWMRPYLEGQLKLSRGDYRYSQDKTEYSEYDLDALASRYSNERRMSLEAKKLLGKPLVEFSTPDYEPDVNADTTMTGVQTDECITDESLPKENQVDPKTPTIGSSGGIVQFVRPITASGLEDKCANCQCHTKNNDGVGMFSPGLVGQMRILAGELISSETTAQEGFSKALVIGNKLVESNSSMRSQLKTVLSRLDKELKMRQVSEKQLSLLKKELSGTEAQERMNDPIKENIRAEKAFRIKRHTLAKQLKAFHKWVEETKAEEAARDLKREESRIHGSHEHLMKKLKNNIDMLENTREREWLEFVGRLDGLNARDIEIWRALRAVDLKTGLIHLRQFDIPRVSGSSDSLPPSECMYCDIDGCGGCSGDAEEFARPWLDL